MKWAQTSAYLCLFLMAGSAASAPAQGRQSRQAMRGTVRVDQANLPYELKIEPTRMQANSSSIETGGDAWIARGYDLKTLIAQVFDVDARRIDFPDGIADGRYDVTLALPSEAGEEAIQQVLADALQRKFRLAITPESRTMDVYVMSAPEGPKGELHRHPFPRAAQPGMTAISLEGSDGGEGRITYMGKECSGVASGGIAVSGGTIADFRRTLEPDLDRVLVDETHLSGSYDFKIASYSNKDELFKLLREQLGLTVTPVQRKVTVLTVKPIGSMQAAM